MTDFVFDVLRVNGEDFDSEAFHGAAYNRETKQMWLEFRSGGTYIYEGVEESTFNLFVGSESLGSFWRSHISGKYTSSGDIAVELVEREPVENELDSALADDTSTHESPSKFAINCRFAVEWTNGTLNFKPEYNAASETEALVQWNTALSMAGITDAKIVSVTHYFD